MLLQEMTWPEIGNLSRDIPVLVPVAALEQHGHHMRSSPTACWSARSCGASAWR